MFKEKIYGDITPATITKFGIGNQAEEKNCKEVDVFITCYGVQGDNIDKRRYILPKNSTVSDARSAYILDESNKGLIRGQDLITDEDHFVFGESELKRPLTDYSNNCHLNIALLHSDKSPVKQSYLRTRGKRLINLSICFRD